ncbi:polymeric immunoglobulin receptor-like [Archocentrus centrarchus]|uniref:polymeric immunoglobulin receptor-like n=1 Tax=Archocentrus centrarchus TaxID=63155 RepID=UPI0011E9B82D|nr:polymeric immunoglobulin receptor-like [Archocentrus centrarchus]
MAAHLIVLLLFSGLKGVHSITTVNKVSVTAGKSVSIPCLYESQYMNHVKYLCEGQYWTSCSYAVKTNKPDRSGKYSISDDKKQQIFTVTINQLTNKNTDYWCVVEINGGSDHGESFQLLVTSGTPSLYVDHQQITGYIGKNITIRCHHSNSGGMKWCRLGRNCVTGSSGSIDGTTATTNMTEPNVFTVTMSGLKPEDSGWYWCAEGDIQIPVHLTVTEELITRASFPVMILIMTALILIAIVLFIQFILRRIYCILLHRVSESSLVLLEQSKAESLTTVTEQGNEVTYSTVLYMQTTQAPKPSFAESDVDNMYSSVFYHKETKYKMGMAAHLIGLLLFSGLKGVQSITTVSKVSVTAGKSVSIPCLYESQYMNHVKYLCEGQYWTSCSYAVKTNKPDRSGKYSISDDKKQQIFTVTINQLTNKNTHYWCVVEINGGLDHGELFRLSVTTGTPSLYVDHQQITGYIGENITIRCHHSNSGGMKWCRLGRKCVTGSSGSINRTTVTTNMTEPNVFTVTMSGLKPEDSGWYWCAEGDIQIPVHLTVTEKPITTSTHTVTGNGTNTLENEEYRASFDPKILIIPLSVLILIVIVVLIIWFILRHKQSKAESSATAMAGEEVTYSEVRAKKRSSAKVDEEVTFSNLEHVGRKTPEVLPVSMRNRKLQDFTEET